MIEVVAATMIVGIVMVAALDTLGAYVRGKTQVAVQSRASLLAQDLMSEILDRNYDEPDDAPRQRDAECDDTADDERCACDRAPQERFAHEAWSL